MEIKTSEIIAASKLRQTALIIHKYATVHAATAGLLAQTIVGDTLALSFLTVAMESTIVALNGGRWTKKLGAAVLSIMTGTYVGVYGGAFLLKWMPGIGNAANAAASFVTTELVGWTTYVLLSSGLSIDVLTDTQKKAIFEEAKRMAKNEKGNGKQMYKRMSREDKNRIDTYVKQIVRASEDKDESVLNDLAQKFAEIAAKY